MTHIETTSFYVTLLSNTSRNLYPDITIATFTTDVARPIGLGSSDNWEVGLCEFSYSPKNMGTFKSTKIAGDSTLLIYCDHIAPQYVGRALDRCMRTFSYPAVKCQYVFDNVYYLHVEKRTFKFMRIDILELTGKPFEFKSGSTPSS